MPFDAVPYVGIVLLGSLIAVIIIGLGGPKI